MPKIKIFLWQLCHNSLPSRSTLLRRGIQLDPLCPACSNDLEDSNHTFLHCPMAHKVWDMAVAYPWLPNLSFTQLVSSLCEELHSLANNRYPRLSRVVLLLWSIWKSSNALVFRNEISSPMGTLLRAKCSWAEWKLRTSPSFYPSTIPSYSPYHTHPHPKSTQFIG